MARRKDGSARRYEFQIFDNAQGRAIAQALDQAQGSGHSAADFIRAALLFYIEHQPRAPESPAPKLQQEINALWQALAQTSRNVPAVASVESPGEVLSSTGLDLSSPRRRSGSARAAPSEARAAAVFDQQEAQQRLLASIKSYGQVTREAYRGSP